MTTSTTRKTHVGRLLSIGLTSGVVFAILFSSWPIIGAMASGWIIWADAKKRPTRLTDADSLRMAGGWFLAVMLCNLLLNWGSFQTGFIAGWQAAP